MRTLAHRVARRTIVLASASLAAVSAFAQNAITRVVVDRNGVEGNWNSPDAAITPDGRFVGFSSFASNLVPDDHNDWANAGADVFVRDMATGAIVRVSLSSSGAEGNDCSYLGSLSADGRFVAFVSFASNLVLDDRNGCADVFVHDRDPDANGVFDEGNGVTTRVSVATGGTECDADCYAALLSSDGAFVLFGSTADNLVANDTNGTNDIFRHDLATGVTTRVSLGPGDVEPDGSCSGHRLSDDGTVMAFISEATNLVPGDTNGQCDLFLRDLTTGAIERISVDSAGGQGDGPSTGVAGITSDRSLVAFSSYATNLVAADTNGKSDLFVHDRRSGVTTRVSLGQGGVEPDANSWGALSADGSKVLLNTDADNMVAGDGNAYFDVFLRDLATGDVSLVGTTRAGGFPNYDSFVSGATADFRRILFVSLATDIVSYDTNGASEILQGEEVFLRDLTLAAGAASTESYASGLAGANGIPSLSSSSPPVLGASIQVDLGNSSGASTFGVLLGGVAPAGIALRGGTLVVAPGGWIVPLAIGPTGAALDAVVTNDAAARGVSIFTQLVELDPAAPRGMSMSRGLEFVVGD